MPKSRSITIYWHILTKRGTKPPTFRGVLVSSLILMAAVFPSSGEGKIVDRIVAIVNEDIITLSELEEFRKSFFRFRPEGDDWLGKELGLLEVRRQALNAMIDEKLLDQEANRQNIQVGQQQLDDTLESLRKERGLTLSQLEMALKDQGITYEAYTAEVEKGLRRTRLINRVVKSEIEINEEDLKNYYETHIMDYMANESIRISHMLLPLPENSTQDGEEAVLSRAKEILQRVEKGEDFDILVREYSQKAPGIQGGDMGYFKKGEMIAAIEKRAFALEVGQVGGPIQTPAGMVLIKVTDRKGGSPIPLAKIKKKVEADYYNQEMERRYRQWLNKLKARSFIEVKL